MTKGIVYDAVTVSRILLSGLGLSAECRQAVYDEIVVYYGGWDLKQLRISGAGKKHMKQDQDWYESYGWTAEPGCYRLLLPVPRSNEKSWSEQLRHLAAIDPAWQPAPICIAATALLVHLGETGNDLLKNDWCRCAEALPRDNRAELTVVDGRVSVHHYWDDSPSAHVGLATARKF